jgi:hypothetical protein
MRGQACKMENYNAKFKNKKKPAGNVLVFRENREDNTDRNRSYAPFIIDECRLANVDLGRGIRIGCQLC